MSQPRLLQMSGVIVDLIYQIDEMPLAGGEANVGGCMISAGGGFNAMMAAKRSGMEVVYGGSIGTGVFSQLVLEALHGEGCKVLQDPNPDADQGSCVVLVDSRGERSFISSAGADGMMNDKQLAAIDPADGSWVLATGYLLSYAGSRQAIAGWLGQQSAGVNLVFDPSPVIAKVSSQLRELMFAKARWISANLDEARLLTAENTADAAARKMADLKTSNQGGVVVRDGADGCWVVTDDGSLSHQPGFKVNAIDTNGAGDAHIGAFVAALSRNVDPLSAAEIANAVAAISTTAQGPATAPELEYALKFITDMKSNRSSGLRAG